jgi:formate dehydrogenase major subunit
MSDIPWPVLKQLESDPLALGQAAESKQTHEWSSRNAGAKVVRSICPYGAVGCGQRVYVKDEKIVQIEGDPDSPISRGRLCPKGSATRSYVQSPLREYKVKYRRPYATQWESLSLDEAMDMIADRVIATRAATWQEKDDQGHAVNRTLAIGSIGGATLDNEENYLMKKLYTALGVVQVENQARI